MSTVRYYVFKGEVGRAGKESVFCSDLDVEGFAMMDGLRTLRSIEEDGGYQGVRRHYSAGDEAHSGEDDGERGKKLHLVLFWFLYCFLFLFGE